MRRHIILIARSVRFNQSDANETFVSGWTSNEKLYNIIHYSMGI